MDLCSCGKREPHVIAERNTLDEMRVCLWSDGTITGVMGRFPHGLGAVRVPTVSTLRAGWMIIEEVGLYDWKELPNLVKAARKAVAQTMLPEREFMRRYASGERFRMHGKVVISTRE